MHRQTVAIFEDKMKKISSGPINSLNVGNYDSPGNKLKRLCDTFLSQERDNTKITDTVLAVFTLFKDVNLVKEKDQEMLWKPIHNYGVNEKQILRCVSGYIVLTLKKEYKTCFQNHQN